MSTRTCDVEGCGALIRFVVTEAGASMPLDVDPQADGTVIAVTRPDGTVVARVLSGNELPAQQTAWRPHFQTCPGAEQRRRRRERTRKACTRTGCRTPLDDVLVALGLTMHPGCEDGDPLPHERPVVTVVRGEARPVATGPTTPAPAVVEHEQLDLLGGAS